MSGNGGIGIEPNSVRCSGLVEERLAGLTPLLFETSTQALWIKPIAVSLAFGELFSTVIVVVLLPAAIRAVADLRSERVESAAVKLVPRASQG